MKFSEIQLHPALQANIERLQFLECTKIQAEALPHIRTGKDVAGLAQTGTGKTGAFLMPLIDRLLKAQFPDAGTADSPTVAFPEWKRKQFILILVPTRELAEQVQDIAGKLLEGTELRSVSIYGGTTYDKQIAALKDGVEFVIATPGRLIDLYKEHVCDLGMVRAIVFDEADRMFDMGFKEDMKFILNRVPRDRQFTVFSATLNFDVLAVAYEFGSDPIEINISRDQPKAENVTDSILHIGQGDKPATLLSLLKKHEPRQTIIFSNYKHSVERIATFLNLNKIPAVGISSLMTQSQRLRVMEQFKGDNDRNILVATDLAARGLDILGVDMVINFDLPDDAENYVHRIGRTGRAGQTGTALSLVSDRDVDALGRIEEYLKHKVEVAWLDDAEILKDYVPFPRDESRFKRPGGPDRGARPERSGGGRGGPRRERGGGGDRAGGSERAATPERAPGERIPIERAVPGAAAAAGKSPRRESHRDRQSGRHRDADGASSSAEASGNKREPREKRERGAALSGRNRGAAGKGADGRKGAPIKKLDSTAPRAAGASRIQKRGAAPAAGQGKSSAGIGAKVSGFFKKLFGN